jgi:hypothetical protein
MRPERAKVRHIRAKPSVAINLNSDFQAQQVTVLIGEAQILGEQPGGPRQEAYVVNYLEGMQRLDHTLQSFLEMYSTPIEITLDRSRARFNPQTIQPRAGECAPQSPGRPRLYPGWAPAHPTIV